MKLAIYLSNQAVFSTRPKVQGKSLNALWQEKKSAKNDGFFASDDFFCRLIFYQRLFLSTINFYRRIFFQTFFLQMKAFSIF